MHVASVHHMWAFLRDPSPDTAWRSHMQPLHTLWVSYPWVVQSVPDPEVLFPQRIRYSWKFSSVWVSVLPVFSGSKITDPHLISPAIMLLLSSVLLQHIRWPKHQPLVHTMCHPPVVLGLCSKICWVVILSLHDWFLHESSWHTCTIGSQHNQYKSRQD